jgi:hypothetical protein
MTRGLVGWLLAFLLGLALGWGGRELRGREDPWGALVLARRQQASAARAAFAEQGSRANLARLIRALLNERDALSVARYPQGEDPHRYEVGPGVPVLLNDLSARSVTPAERREWELLYNQAYNPPPR